jgi:hypothetical protein
LLFEELVGAEDNDVENGFLGEVGREAFVKRHEPFVSQNRFEMREHAFGVMTFAMLQA